jgi:hypothetical protein
MLIIVVATTKSLLLLVFAHRHVIKTSWEVHVVINKKSLKFARWVVGGHCFLVFTCKSTTMTMSSKNVLAIVIPFKCLHTTNTRIKKYKTRWGGGRWFKTIDN